MVLGVPSRPDAPGSCARPSLGGSLPGLSLLVRVCPPFSALPGILILYGRLSFLSLRCALNLWVYGTNAGWESHQITGALSLFSLFLYQFRG